MPARVPARLFHIAHRLAAHTGQKCSILNRCRRPSPI